MRERRQRHGTRIRSGRGAGCRAGFGRLLGLGFWLLSAGGCAVTGGEPPLDEARLAALREQQQQTAFDAWLADWIRLNRVAHRLYAANAAVCGGRARLLPGALWLTQRDFPEPLRGIAARNGYGHRPRVAALPAPDAPPDPAVTAPGDEITALAGEALPESRRAARRLSARLAVLQMPAGGAVQVAVARAGGPAEVRLALVRACRFDLDLSRSDAINAYAGRSRITVTRGMMGFVASDHELAFVLAHEMAHGLAHSLPERLLAGVSERLANTGAALYRAATLRRLPPPAPRTYSQVLETEADRLALRYLAAAGYDPSSVVDFWHRLAARHPRSVTPGYQHSHPTSPERLARLEQALQALRSAPDRR